MSKDTGTEAKPPTRQIRWKVEKQRGDFLKLLQDKTARKLAESTIELEEMKVNYWLAKYAEAQQLTKTCALQLTLAKLNLNATKDELGFTGKGEIEDE